MKRDITYLVVIACALGLAFFFYNKYRRQVNLNQNQSSIITEKNDSIRYWINQHGREVSEKAAAQATAKQLAESYPQLKQELKDEFDINIRDLKAYIRNEIAARGQGDASVINHYYVDSTGNRIQRRTLSFNDGYLNFISEIDSTQIAKSIYTYSDTIVTAVHSQKKWFLGKETLHASSSLKNPNARVLSATNLIVNDVRDKRFVIYVGAGYDPFARQPTINVGIGYALFKF